MREGPCVFCLKWNGPREALKRKKAGFPCSGLNAGSSIISQEESMSEPPVFTPVNALGLCLSGQGTSHPFDTSRGVCISILQKMTMPDSS